MGAERSPRVLTKSRSRSSVELPKSLSNYGQGDQRASVSRTSVEKLIGLIVKAISRPVSIHVTESLSPSFDNKKRGLLIRGRVSGKSKTE
jgi:hypothetical protein